MAGELRELCYFDGIIPMVETTGVDHSRIFI